jgi:hypothetical protein
VIPGYRTRRLLALAGLVATFALVTPRIMAYRPYARLGVVLDWTPQGHARVSSVVGPPAQGLLEQGDMLLAVNGQPLTPPASGLSSLTLPREALTLKFERKGHEMEVLVPPVNVGVWQRIRFMLGQLTAVIAGPLVAFVLVWRRPDLATAAVFLWFACLDGLSFVTQIYRFPVVEPAGFFRWFMAGVGWIVCWAPASFLHFMLMFPRPRWTASNRWRNPWFWVVVAGYIAPVWLVFRLVRTGSPDAVAYRAFEAAALLIGVTSLVDRALRPPAGDWRPSRGQRVLMLVAGALYLAATVLDIVVTTDSVQPFLQLPLVRVVLPWLGIAVALVPFIIAYLIALDPVFDPRRLVARGLPYALLSGMLAALYLAVVFVGQRLFAALTGEQTIMLNVAAALVIAFVFAPLRDALQRWLARLFRRDPLLLRASLDTVGRELLGALDPAEVRASVETGLARGLGRPLPLEWPEGESPRLAEPEHVPDDARGAIENLLTQARIRIENLALQRQRAAAERRAVELREAATRAELSALHAQVQPHFLFNALNTLSYLIETDPAAAQRFTERLADMLRYTVEASQRGAALLSDEIAFVEDYIGVARERYEGDLAFEYHGPQDLLGTPVPPLLLQPLVENSLKHGLKPEREGLHMTLVASREDGWLTFTFADDGVANGRATRGNGTPGNGSGSHGRGPAGLGFGLGNLDQRVRRFGGRDASLAAGVCEGGGFAVTLRWREGEGAEEER